jgi:hypothetical protein
MAFSTLERIMPMSCLLILSALLFTACGSHAGAYLVAPAPVWAPSPTPEAAAPAAVETPSPTAAVTAAARRHSKASATETPTATMTPTATITPTQGTGIYLMPLQDKRKQPEIWSGRSVYEKVVIEAQGRTLLAEAWRKKPFGDVAYLWDRQFAYALADNGYQLQTPPEPLLDEGLGLAMARSAGAKYLLTGQINRLSIAKRGADSVTGTNFTGTNFFFNLELHLKAVEVSNGQVALDRKIELQRKFYDPTYLGSEERDTFPRYFATGLPELAVLAAGDLPLRKLAGLPTYTPTNTPTATPEIFEPKPGDKATPVPTATPDAGPYWINPKTGKRVDPAFNFDPADGTPRSQFILVQPTPKPSPSRATEQR